MEIQIVDSQGDVLWTQDTVSWDSGDDYSTLDRSRVSQIVLKNDDGSTHSTYSPTASESAQDVMVRRRTIKGDQTQQVLIFFGFPASTSDAINMLEGNTVIQIDPDPALVTRAPVNPRENEFGTWVSELIAVTLFSNNSLESFWNTNWAEQKSVPGPGYTRINNDATNVKNSPNQSVWSGPEEYDNNNVLLNVSGGDPNNNPPVQPYQRMRNAAWVYRRTQDSGYLTGAKSIFQRTIRQSRLDASKRSGGTSTSPVYPLSGFSDKSPYHDLGQFLAQMVITYDLIRDQFSTAEQDEAKQWLYHMANWLSQNTANNLDQLFQNRNNENYTLTSTGRNASTSTVVGYRDADGNSKLVCRLQKFYNNRKFSGMYPVLLVCILLLRDGYTGDIAEQTVAQMYRNCKNFFKEWLLFGWYGDEFPGEFERGTDGSDAWSGYNYFVGMVQQISAIVLASAMYGDLELINFSTRSGTWLSGGELNTDGNGTPHTACASGEPDKTFLNVILASHKYVQQEGANPFGNKRYNTAQSGRVGNANYLHSNVDRSSATTRQRVRDTATCAANVYYQNQTIKDGYKRLLLGAPSIGEYPVINNGYDNWEGGHFADAQFLFRDAEGLVTF